MYNQVNYEKCRTSSTDKISITMNGSTGTNESKFKCNCSVLIYNKGKEVKVLNRPKNWL